MFKKRVIKGKFRSDIVDQPIVEGSYDEDGSSLCGRAVMEMKLEQSLRRKKLGNEYSSEAGGVIEKSERKFKSSVQRSIESTLGSQFESRVEDGLSSSTLAHEKIMEQYINQKMGIQDASPAPVTKEQSQDDELYRIPDEIKYASAIKISEGTEDEDKEVGGGDQFMSLGIAEVALPMSFKLSNINETDESRRRIEAERHAKYGSRQSRSLQPNSGVAEIPATGTARFWNPSMSSFIQQQEKDKIKATDFKTIISGPALEIKSNNNEFSSDLVNTSHTNGNNNNGKRRNFSNDDHVMNKFKSNQRNRK